MNTTPQRTMRHLTPITSQLARLPQVEHKLASLEELRTVARQIRQQARELRRLADQAEAQARLLERQSGLVPLQVYDNANP